MHAPVDIPALHQPSAIAHHATALARLYVLSTRREIAFRDGSLLNLHLVQQDGVTHPYLHAYLLPADPNGRAPEWHVVDLRHVAPELEQDLLRMDRKDHAGLVFYTLRHRYAGAVHCAGALMANAAWRWTAGEPAKAAA